VLDLSVGIPCYNEEKGIERAVRSCFAACPNAEVVVSDNASTDRTPEILSALAREFPLLRVIRQNVQISLQDNFSAVLSAMNGHFGLFLPGHHFLLPQVLSRLMIRLRSDETLAICFGGVVWRSLKGQYTLKMPPYTPGRIERSELFARAMFAAPDATATVYRLKHIRSQGFHPTLERTGFWELLLRTCLMGDAWFEPEAVTCWVEYRYPISKHLKAIDEFEILDAAASQYADAIGISKSVLADTIKRRNLIFHTEAPEKVSIRSKLSLAIRRYLPSSIFLAWYSWKLGLSPLTMLRSIRQAKMTFEVNSKGDVAYG